jgi:15-cis-phytoene synthase
VNVSAVTGPGGPPIDYMSRHGRSFRFAVRFMPPRQRQRIANVYAWCRYTDDLVDRSDSSMEETEARLDSWLELSYRAYLGHDTGIRLLDDVFGDMRSEGVPFEYAAQLVEGVRMDLRTREYGTMRDLERYTYRVASVVGLWLTRLFGVDDEWMLHRASRLGHAMQLTNILRDVGEDLRNGRVYLPSDRLRAHGVDRRALEESMSAGSPPPRGLVSLLDELMGEADRAYEDAWEAIPRLPLAFRCVS